MTGNGDTNGYVQVFKGPDGKPMVVLRASDFAAIIKRVADLGSKRTHKEDLISRPVMKNIQALDIAWEHQDIHLKYVVERFNRLLREAPQVHTNDHGDEDAYRNAKTALASGEDEVVPGAIAKRLLAGETPLRVWREHRGLKQTELADVTGVGQDVISKIENNKRTGDVATIKALADGLGVLVDDLVI